MQKAVDSNSFAAVGLGSLKVHTLQFADDTLLFFDGSLRAAAVIKLILEAFSESSGLNINYNKSALIPINLPQDLAAALSSSFRCSTKDFPLTYLGLPLTPKPLTKPEFLPLLEKIDKRLAGWKEKSLSRGGRLILLNSVLSSIPTYFASVFRLPVWVQRAIDKIRRGFFWRGKKLSNGFHCLVKWDVICRPKLFGGLGVRNLKCMNSALLLRAMWRFYNAPLLPWVQLLRLEHYKCNPLSPSTRIGPCCSPFWKAIISLVPPFFISTAFSQGNGNFISFWLSRWCGEFTLQAKFPHLFAAARLKQASVSVWFSRFAQRPIRGFKLPLNAVCQSQIHQFSNFVASISLSSEDNSIIWRWQRDGKFTVRSAYIFLIFGGVVDRTITYLWKLKIPLRIKLFLWLASRNRVLAAEILSKRGWHGPSICTLCYKSEEKLEHILFECSFASNLWTNLLQGIPNTLHNLLQDPGDLIARWRRARTSQSGQAKINFHCCFAATCWEIWKERNSRIFDNRVCGSGELGIKVLSSVFLWNSTL